MADEAETLSADNAWTREDAEELLEEYQVFVACAHNIAQQIGACGFMGRAAPDDLDDFIRAWIADDQFVMQFHEDDRYDCGCTRFEVSVPLYLVLASDAAAPALIQAYNEEQEREQEREEAARKARYEAQREAEERATFERLKSKYGQ